MQAFRVLGAVFIGICVLVMIGTALPMLAVMGGDGFGGLGGFGFMAAVPGVVFTLLPLGIVFLVVANLFGRMLGPAPTGIAGGVPAVATVRRTSRTSMRVNGQPVLHIDLELAVPGRGVVPVSVRRTVPPEHLAAVAVGAVLPAVADPRDLRRFAIDWDRVGLPDDAAGFIATLDRAGIHLDPAHLAGAGTGTVSGPSEADAAPDPADPWHSPTDSDPWRDLPPAGPDAGTSAATGGEDDAASIPPSELLGTDGDPRSDVGDAGVVLGGTGGTTAAGVRADADVDVTGATLSALRAAGMPARGVIREAGDLGISIGEGRLFRLRLDVIREDRTGYRVDHIALVPATSRWRIVTGVTLPLFVDRTEPARLAIDWSA